MELNKSNCDETSGKVYPIINLSNCGGKEDCVPACPYDVLEMRPIADDDRLTLNFKGKIKTFFKPNKAYVTDPDLCFACGLCVQVCPEKAIKLARVDKS
jgi:NAD-dependent dihydropyrimidine dehydrogenase PreA subunit